MCRRDEGLGGQLVFSASLCSQAAAERMTKHFSTLLATAVAQPSTAISALPLMEEVEQQLVLHRFNNTAAPLPELCIHQFFEQQAAATPVAKCLIQGDSGRSLTYAEVNARANQLAHCLVASGVCAGTAVAVLSDKRPELYIALLAVLKAGGCYVPIDPTLPAARVAVILQQSAAKLMLAESTIETLQQLPPVKTLHLDKDCRSGGQPISNPPTTCKPTAAAYVLFTSGAMSAFVQQPTGIPVQCFGRIAPHCLLLLSHLDLSAGSTGVPKGVRVPHTGVVNAMLTNKVRSSG